MNFFLRRKRAFFVFLFNRFSGTKFFRTKRCLLKWAGIKIGKGTKIVGPIYIGNVAKLEIGSNVWIGTQFKVYGNGEVLLGNDIDIAPEVCFLTGSHMISNNGAHRAGNGVSYKIKIDDGCWIGARCTLLGNIEVGKGSVIGACSVVKDNVNRDSLYVGVPAKLKKELTAK